MVTDQVSAALWSFMSMSTYGYLWLFMILELLKNLRQLWSLKDKDDYLWAVIVIYEHKWAFTTIVEHFWSFVILELCNNLRQLWPFKDIDVHLWAVMVI